MFKNGNSVVVCLMFFYLKCFENDYFCDRYYVNVCVF